MNTQDGVGARSHGSGAGSRWIATVFFILTGVWVALPLGAMTLLQQHAVAMELAPARSVWVQVESNSDSIGTPLGLSLRWTTSAALLAPDWSGTVQKIGVEVGERLVSGQVVATIDGIQRIGFSSAVPLTKSLALGDTDPQVSILSEMLRDLGFAITQTNRYSGTLAAAVRDFARSIGVADSDGSVFDSGWIVYMPGPSLTVRELNLSVAGRAPAPGEPILTPVPALAGGSLVNLEFLGRQNNEAQGLTPVDSDLVVPGEGQSLSVNGVSIPFESGSSVISAEALREFEHLVQPEALAVRATLYTPSDPSALVVPSAAVYVSPSGDTCINLGAPDDRRSEIVSIVTQTAGRTVIRGNVTSRDRVETAPLPGDRTCG